MFALDTNVKKVSRELTNLFYVHSIGALGAHFNFKSYFILLLYFFCQ